MTGLNIERIGDLTWDEVEEFGLEESGSGGLGGCIS